jgi:hypothetical protein
MHGHGLPSTNNFVMHVIERQNDTTSGACRVRCRGHARTPLVLRTPASPAMLHILIRQFAPQNTARWYMEQGILHRVRIRLLHMGESDLFPPQS